MAVQAQHPSNLPIYSDNLLSVREAVKTMQTCQLTIDLPPPVGKAAGGGMNAFSDNPQNKLTCDVSRHGKRCRDEQYGLDAPASEFTFHPSSQPAVFDDPFALLNGSVGANNDVLMAPSDKRMRLFDSSSASTSGRLTNVPMQSAPTPFSMGQDILAEIFDIDVDNRLQNDQEERQRRRFISLLSIFAAKYSQKKETELRVAKQIIAELQDQIQKMSAEHLFWYNEAKRIDALALNLKKNLEQAQQEKDAFASFAAAVVVTPLAEGYGDSDGIRLLEDVESCIEIEGEKRLAPAAPPIFLNSTGKEITSQQTNCKVCGVIEASMFVLPCGHFCMCQNCEPKVTICPVCNYPRTHAYKFSSEDAGH